MYGGSGGQKRNGPTFSAPFEGRYQSNAYDAVVYTRYIIFIIRARDTRSRARLYNAPVSVNRI